MVKAGVWGHATRRREILERGDVEEALNAASAIGDDRLQRRSGGEVNPTRSLTVPPRSAWQRFAAAGQSCR